MSRELGRYELLRPLARGGMAEVFLARRRAAGVEKWLVVKRIRAEWSKDPRLLDLFVREARLSMSLVHQNIVPVFDFGRIDDQVFLAMERVEGKDLGSCLARAHDRPLPPLLAAFIAAECCQALDYAHRRKAPDGAALGIVHRDVTPRNVLLSWAGEVKLTDFGIAALAGDARGIMLGTPAYMAPEQARNQPVDPRADIYAIGLVLREALTGERARPGEGRDGLVEMAKAGRLKPWPASATGPLLTIVDHATALRPDDRYRDARTMLADLDAFIVSERAATRSATPSQMLASWLAERWGDHRDEAEGASSDRDDSVEGSQLVSFLDDGLDVIGTGTVRSQQVTAADSAIEDPPGREPQVAPQPDPPRAPGNLPTPIHARRVATAVIVTALSGLLVVAVIMASRPPLQIPDKRAQPAVTRVDALAAPPPPRQTELAGPTPPLAAAPDAGTAITEPRDGGLLAIAPDAGRRPGASAPTHGRPTRPAAATAPEGSAGSATPATLRAVTINAVPWAHFTIDGSSVTYETPKTVQLAPGHHQVRFTNPILDVQRDVTIEVPHDRDISWIERF
ncbi:MAG: protein kinase [Kofleriaceae bacterium]